MTVVRGLGPALVTLSMLAGAASPGDGTAAAAVSGTIAPADPAHAFDFWIGDWRIHQKILQADGSWLELPARTSVRPAVEGRALIEHWEGQVRFFWEGMADTETVEGLSVRAYDPEVGEWKIHWMDSRHPAFGDPFHGTFEGRVGTFFRRRVTERGIADTRVTFRPAGPDSVRWDLAVSSDGGDSWRTLWVMEMGRAR